jgi:hypothetical protein
MGSDSVNLALRLSTGDSESVHCAEIDITPNQSGPIVKHRFHVEPARARPVPVINIDKQRISGEQNLVSQEIVLPTLGSGMCGVNFDYRHSCIVSQLDVPV